MSIQAKELFEAETNSLWETFMAHNSAAGYRLPQYQREYTWDQEKLDRLLEDCLNGFSRLSQENDPGFTFLGSIILTRGGGEPSFDGFSLWVIDGQQRLTSLTLTACALFQLLRTHKSDVDDSDEELREWLASECNLQLVMLRQCVLGEIPRLTGSVFYPRLVRIEDTRGGTVQESEYSSPIARFVVAFMEYLSNPESEFPPDDMTSNTEEHLLKTYHHIYQRLHDYLYDSDFQGEDGPLDAGRAEFSDFALPGFTSLWMKLGGMEQEPQERKVALLERDESCEGFVRTLLFSSYAMQRVVLTRVESQDEEYAFDMFDSLNTTGEPLTALETFKPLVVRLENRKGSGYSGSRSQERWDSLEQSLRAAYPVPSRRQNESKRLLTSFALYLDGYKLPLHASSQRSYLRERFRRAEQVGVAEARSFIDNLASVGEYRARYWEATAIDGLRLSDLDQSESETLRLCLRFIADMNTALAVPVLARYWVRYGDGDERREFLQAAKAVAAFLALRRATTAGTSGIDSDFRRLMRGAPVTGGAPLAIGIPLSNEVMDVRTLRSELRRLLGRLGIDLADKEPWLRRAEEIDLGARAPQALNRLLLFAAHHNARPDGARPGMLTRDNVVPGSDIASLTHRNWIDLKYATVEHVAPRSDPGVGWDSDIYRRQSTRNLLGNLVLLPEKENQAIGNAPWAKKRAFYAALASRDTSEREGFLELAKKEGLGFGRRTEDLLRGQERLHLLEPAVAVDEWTEEVIHDRTRTNLSLAWDELSPWLRDSLSAQTE